MNYFELNFYRLLMQKRTEKLDVLLYGFAYFSVHNNAENTVYRLLALCIRDRTLLFIFFNLFLQKSSHTFTFQCESCNEEAIKLL